MPSDELERLFELTVALGNTLDSTREATTFVNWLLVAVQPALVALFVRDPEGERLRIEAAHGFVPPPEETLPLGLDPWHWLETHEVALPAEGRSARYTVPIVLEQQLLGMLCLVGRRQGPSLSEEQRLVQTAVGYLAPVLRNIARYRTLEQEVRARTRELAESEARYRRLAERLRGLREIDRAILEASQPETIAEAALARLRELVPCVGAGVALFDLERMEARILALDAETPIPLQVGSRLSLRGLEKELGARRRDSIFYETDLPSRKNLAQALHRLSQIGVRAFLATPLLADGDLIGCLVLGSSRPADFDQEALEIAGEVADVLALAVQQARMHLRIKRHADELEEAVGQRTRELAESEARYRRLVENPVVGIWQADAEGRLVFVNTCLATLCGGSQEEILGRSALDFVAPEWRGHVEAWLLKAGRNKVSLEPRELDLVRPDGSRLTALVAPAPLHDEAGQLIGYLGAVIDITERKRLERELEKQLAEQRRLVRLMAGREVRMAELKHVIRRLRAQLQAAGLTPIVDDPLRAEQ